MQQKLLFLQILSRWVEEEGKVEKKVSVNLLAQQISWYDRTGTVALEIPRFR